MDLAGIAALEAAWQGRIQIEDAGECWDWAPADLAVFCGLLAAAVPLCPPGVPFVAAGGGIGTKCLLAMQAGLAAENVERVPQYAAQARELGVTVRLADARDWDGYGRAGIVYVNHPLRDPAAEKALERRIHGLMAPGAVLMLYNAGCFPPDSWREVTADRPAWRGVWVKP